MAVDPAESWADLSALRRDLLVALASVDEVGSPTSGADVRDALEEHRDGAVDTGQFYRNLDALVDAGLVAKDSDSGRRNHYELTTDGRHLVERMTMRAAQVVGLEVETPAETPSITRAIDSADVSVEPTTYSEDP